MRASKKVKGAVLLSAGAALVLGAPTVHADSSADDNNGLVSGLNLLNDVQLNVPVTVGGAGVLGVGDGTSVVKSENKASSSSSSSNSGGGSSSANNNHGLLGGVNLGNNLQASVPVTVCGVGALLAKGTGDCTVAAANTGGGGGSSSANGNSGLVGGLNALNNAQLNVPGHRLRPGRPRRRRRDLLRRGHQHHRRRWLGCRRFQGPGLGRSRRDPPAHRGGRHGSDPVRPGPGGRWRRPASPRWRLSHPNNQLGSVTGRRTPPAGDTKRAAPKLRTVAGRVSFRGGHPPGQSGMPR